MNEEQVRLAARYILQLAIAYYETEEGKKSGRDSAGIRKEGRNTRKIRQKCKRLTIFEPRRIRKGPGQFASGHSSSGLKRSLCPLHRALGLSPLRQR